MTIYNEDQQFLDPRASLDSQKAAIIKNDLVVGKSKIHRETSDILIFICQAVTTFDAENCKKDQKYQYA